MSTLRIAKLIDDHERQTHLAIFTFLDQPDMIDEENVELERRLRMAATDYVADYVADPQNSPIEVIEWEELFETLDASDWAKYGLAKLESFVDLSLDALEDLNP